MTDRTRPEPEPEATRKRRVRVWVDEEFGAIVYNAATQTGSATLATQARGATLAEALDNLKALVEQRAALEVAREGYPKTIEVDW